MSMPALVISLILAALLFVSCGKPPVAMSANTGSTSAVTASVALPNFTALVKKEGPAVINISTTRKMRGVVPFPAFPGLTPDDPFYEFFHHFAPGDEFPREFRSQSLGSGFIVSADGYVLTNAHVVEDADEVTVRLTDQRELKAKVVGTDRRSDIALLKIPAKDLPVVNIGDSSKLEVGEWVVAIGSPFGFTNSVSQGIVSAKGRSLPGENFVPFIQTDVPVNPGNSGGPLFNMNGEVVGINSQIYSQSGGYMGLSFAIPINLAMKIKDELLKHGVVKRGRLGITIQNVSPEHAKSFELAKAGGALVTMVEKNGPADRAGLQIGDIILKLNGKDIANADDLMRTVADMPPGSGAKLQVWRNGSAKELAVKLGEASAEQIAQKQPPDEAAEPGQFGLTLRELTRDEQRELHTDGSLEVESVAGVAAAAGIQPGDIIIAVNSQRVSSIKQLRAELARIGKRAAVLVQRDNNMIFIPLQPRFEP
ncbi:MAG TPA: DegQ family serine endoprotease [Gallionella sp.]|nr:DegQ family serine endoprotease [Gallionella sp.]